MIIVVRIILLILFIILQYYIAKQFESTAADKGYKHSRYFHLCFWFGIVGYILVAALPDRGKDNAKTPNQAYIPNGVVAHMDSPDERSDSVRMLFRHNTLAEHMPFPGARITLCVQLADVYSLRETACATNAVQPLLTSNNDKEASPNGEAFICGPSGRTVSTFIHIP